jgi:septum formation protein
MAKASAVAAIEPVDVVIGADTIVFDELRSYGKPADAVDATAMLARLHGRTHSVATGVAVISTERCVTDLGVSRVTLHLLRHDEIVAYVASGRPLDKAGAYAIQDEDVPTVDAIAGCYCSVMGLPLWRLRRLLSQVGVECRSPAETFSRCRDCPDREAVRMLKRMDD